MFLYDYISSTPIPSSIKERIRGMLPRRLKKHTIRAGPLAGHSIYTSWHDYPGAILGRTEKPLLDWFQRNVTSGETWIDIGAHYGYTAIALSRFTGPLGRVVAFEPVLTTASCVSRTQQLNGLSNLTIVPFALGATPEIRTQELPMVRGMADSTIPTNESSGRIFITSFDALWPALSGNDARIHGVKIDVQGMELDVLLGMRANLTRYQPKLILEFHSGVSRSQVLSTLAEYGYALPGEPLEAVESDHALQYADNHSYYFRPQP